MTDEINWEEAPIGYPIWVQGVGVYSHYSGWHRESTNSYHNIDRSHVLDKCGVGRDFKVYSLKQRKREIKMLMVTINKAQGIDCGWYLATVLYEEGYRRLE